MEKKTLKYVGVKTDFLSLSRLHFHVSIDASGWTTFPLFGARSATNRSREREREELRVGLRTYSRREAYKKSQTSPESKVSG